MAGSEARKTGTPDKPSSNIRFDSAEQAHLIDVAASLDRKSRNAFIVAAAEEKARTLLIERGMDPAALGTAA